MDEIQESELVHGDLEAPSEEAGSPADDTSSIALAEATEMNGTIDETAAAGFDSQPEGPPEPDLLGELASAMHAASARERERLEAAIDDRLNARVEALRARARTESDELRRMADVDIEKIDAWAASEIERIRLAARRRADERRAALDDYLLQHDASVEAEIERVGRAVAIYRERVDAFFAEVEATIDPAAIASLASSVPALPDLENLPAEATIARPAAPQAASREVTPMTAVQSEQPLVGVMEAASVAAPAPIAPLTAIVSGPPTSAPPGDEVPADVAGPAAEAAEESSDAASASAESHHRGAFGLLRTIAPWSRHEDRDAAAASTDRNAESNGH
jgi:hypothetical protein